MLHRLTDLLPKGAGAKPAHPHAHAKVPHTIGARSNTKPTYSRVFRFKADHAKQPQSVEIIGSFTHWRPVPLAHHGAHSWQANIENIEGNKTHHYMLLVDGQPAAYPDSDGYAKPEGAQEERYALTTLRGPRVYMLFAQTK
ncbi:MAG: glycogen-binding domain-containing protein [Verrucomicrobiota bacterium]